VGGNDAGRAARFAWMFAIRRGDLRGINANCVTDAFHGAHVAGVQDSRAGERSWSSAVRVVELQGASLYFSCVVLHAVAPSLLTA